MYQRYCLRFVYIMAVYENSTICKVLHTRLYSPCFNACLLLCLTFRFRYFLLREMPRLSSPLML